MAALTAPAVGNGATVSGLGQTTFITKITGPEEVVGTFETTDVSTTDFKTFKVVPLGDMVKITVEGYHIGTAITRGATGTFTLTWPGAGSYAGTGIVTKVKYPDVAINEPMMNSYEISFDGYTGPAFAPVP